MNKTVFSLLLSTLGVLTSLTGLAAAQTAGVTSPPEFHGAPAADADELPFAVDIAPPPVLPQTITRGDAGKVTVRAVRIDTPLQIDGVLDEEIYNRITPMSDFIQAEPAEGAPATEKTEIWILFDGDNLYAVARCWETHPERIMANELRRDNNNIIQNDNIAFSFDTFYDWRTGVAVQTTPIGARMDSQFATEGQQDYDWNPVWDVKVKRFDGGWTAEFAIPFKSLRYRPGQRQIWSINVRRSNRWKNEISFLSAVPNSIGMGGIYWPSFAATMVGLEAPSGARNIEIKPYVFANLTTDRIVSPAISNDVGADVGIDAKYGITQNLTADFTYNTDFAQVEADSQQINLTRFSLFFPEKREFFLENQGLFNFGGGGSSGGAGGSGGTTPILFYSRRIGLNGGREIPIVAGGRLTGRVGRFSVGAINIHAGDEPVSRTDDTNFTVVRLRRDILRKSALGMIFTGRSVSANGVGSNVAYGVDGRFAFYENFDIDTYWARSQSESLRDDDISYRGKLNYDGDLFGVQAERLAVGDNFNPEVGFVRRHDMRLSSGFFRYSPRPRGHPFIRKLSWSGAVQYIENGGGRLETREQDAQFGIELQSSDQFRVSYLDTYEFLPEAFEISDGIVLASGGYDFSRVRASYEFGRQRQISGTVGTETGSFYTGTRRTIDLSGARIYMGSHFSVEPTFSTNWIDLAEGSFTTRLVGMRLTNTMTPMMFASAFLQYNSSNDTLSANVRLRWEYRPGSELFVVYNDQRHTLDRGFPGLNNRAFIVKVNRLLRF